MPRNKRGYDQAYDRDIESGDDNFDEVEAIPPTDIRNRSSFGGKKLFLLLGFLALLGLAGGAFFYSTRTTGNPDIAPENAADGSNSNSASTGSDSYSASTTGSDSFSALEAGDSYDTSQNDDVGSVAGTLSSALDKDVATTDSASEGPIVSNSASISSDVNSASKADDFYNTNQDDKAGSTAGTLSNVLKTTDPVSTSSKSTGSDSLSESKSKSDESTAETSTAITSTLTNENSDETTEAEKADLTSVVHSVEKLKKVSTIDAKLKEDSIKLEAGAEVATTNAEADNDDVEDEKVIQTESKLHDLMKNEEKKINAKLEDAEKAAGTDEDEKEIIETVRSDAVKVEDSINKADSAEEAAHDLVDSVLSSEEITNDKKAELSNAAAKVVSDITAKETKVEEKFAEEVKTVADMSSTAEDVEDASTDTTTESTNLAKESTNAEQKLENMADKIDAGGDDR